MGGIVRSPNRRRRAIGNGARLLAGALLTSAAPALAQDANRIVVTGTTIPVEREQIGNTLTVIDGETIESRHTAYLQDILREVPGVSVSQGGSFGSLTQVRIRGAEANHVLVLIDGIEVAPVGSGEFDFSTLLADNIDRVEVLRGPQSGLYGSNALAGVINVITRGGDGPAFDAAAEYGSYDNLFGRAGITVGDRETFVSASAIYRETKGFSSAAIGKEPDGDRNLTLYWRGGARLAEIARVDASLRFVDKATDTDGFDFSGGPQQGLAIDDDSNTDSRNWSGGVVLTLEPVDRWENVLSAAYSGDESTGGFGTTDSFGNVGDRLTVAARSTLGFDTPAFADAVHSVTIFIEHEAEHFRNTFPSDPSQVARQARSLLGFGGEYRLGLFKNLFLRGAIRHDDNDAFGDATTYSLAGSWLLGSTRLHASYGTGVTNPTFFEQFGFVPGTFVGNPDLIPERAEGFDLGVEQRFLDDRVLIDITYFNSTLENEIVDQFPSIGNDEGESAREGVELAARIDLGAVSLAGSYTYLDAEDIDGTPEVLRPKNQASFDVSGRFGPASRGTFSASLIYNGERLDNDFRNYFTNGFMAEKTALRPYTLVRVAAGYRFTDKLELFGRLENALDTAYEEVLSYGTASRAVYAGVKFVLP